jgi:hypothetical protein
LLSSRSGGEKDGTTCNYILWNHGEGKVGFGKRLREPKPRGLVDAEYVGGIGDSVCAEEGSFESEIGAGADDDGVSEAEDDIDVGGDLGP